MRKLSCLLLVAVMVFTAVCVSFGCKKGADHFEITIACQSGDSEQTVMEDLIEAYKKVRPEVTVTLKSFSGDDFEVFMNGVSQDEKNSPHIIWTSDSYHAKWEQYFTDLRPYYEKDSSTDYSLYYSSMLDTAAINGKFKPTKNYTGEFRKDDRDVNSDGLEDYTKHSEYGIYFAPRDYNKPAILCNMALFAMLDEQYEKYYKNEKSVDQMPSDYVSSTARLNSIVAGENWNELTDLFDFAKAVAEKVQYVVKRANAEGERRVEATWSNRAALDLKLHWEPSYVTILHAMGIDAIINSDGTLNLEASATKLETLHGYMYSTDNLYYGEKSDTAFNEGNIFMRLESRPALTAALTSLVSVHEDYYGITANKDKDPVQTISIPTDKIAAGCSGYAINSVYEGKGLKVKGEYRSYADMCWDFIKFIITKDGQEVAAKSGNNIPVLKSLYDKESNGGVTPAWRNVAGLENMDHDAWVEGEDLVQDWYYIYKANTRITFRTTITNFFKGFNNKNYNDGTLSELINKTNQAYAASNPKDSLRSNG